MTVLETDCDDELLEQAAVLERRSAHPIGEAIAARGHGEQPAADGGTVEPAPTRAKPSDEDSDGTADNDRLEAFESHRHGVSGTVDGDEVVVGHPDLFRSLGWQVSDALTTQIDDHRETGRVPR